VLIFFVKDEDYEAFGLFRKWIMKRQSLMLL